LRAGERVEAVDGVAIRGNTNFRESIAASPGRELELTLLGADDATRSVRVTPRAQADGTGAIGVGLTVREEDRVIDKVNPIEALGYGAVATWDIIARTGDYVAGIFQGRNSGRDIAGPLGILNVSGQTAEYAMGAPSDDPFDAAGNVALALLSLAAMLSVAVGIVNLLPIPILDGGHLLFYSIEMLRGGKPLPPAAQEWAYRAGFAVMASLFLFATWNDITRLLPGHNG
jgi:regulator of sigma E protease